MKSNPVLLAGFLAIILAFIGVNNSLAQDSDAGVTGTTGIAFVIKPRISLTETWTDNLSVSRSQSDKNSAFITQISPGIRVDAKTARLKGYLDYSLVGNFYSNSSENNRTQNSLNTFGSFEAVSNWLFLDFSARIAQQTISAFGPQSPGSGNINDNTTETSNYRLSPYIRGRLGGLADYSLRYGWSTTKSDASTVSNIEISDWAGQLRGSTPFQSMKWSIDTNQQNTDFSNVRKTEAKRLFATVTYTIIPQFRFSLTGGQESNDYASLTSETHSNYGYGFDWTPTARTQLSFFRERRFFGDGHRYTISHRFPLSSIRYSDTKNVSALPNQFSSVGLGTVFDLFYLICSQQLSSTYTEPDQLDQAARACADTEVTKLGYPPTAQVVSGFLSSQATVQRSQQLALAMQGIRNTLTIMVNQNESWSMLAVTGVTDDFSQYNTNNIRQRGISVNLSHRLSGFSNINMTASRQETTGTGNSTLKATTTLYQANLTTKLGAKTNGGITFRRTEFDATTNPYTENAIIGTVSVVF